MAHLLFRCQSCRRILSVGEEAAGLKGRCVGCEQAMMIPPAAGETSCPHCHEILKFAGDLFGAALTCPSCGEDVQAAPAASHAGGTGAGAARARPAVAAPKPAPADAPRGPLFGFLSKTGWCLLNCVTGESRVVDKFPFDIGSHEAVDWRLDGIRANHCSLVSSKDLGVTLMKDDANAAITINGYDAEDSSLLAPNTDYAITLGPHCFLLRGSKGIEGWLRTVDTREWFILDGSTRHGPMKATEIAGFMSQRSLDPEQAMAMPQGAEAGFAVAELMEALRLAAEKAAAEAGRVEAPEFIVEERRGPGSLVCPVCWLAFDIGDAMHVAVHESLRGDPLLGEDTMLRFLATKFNDKGQALDAMGLPCLDVACPFCHRKLPSGFLETPHHIVSLVGAPSSGKSYLLSVMVKILPRELFKQFGVVFQDADPTGNAALNVMKNRLFAGATPEQVHLDKTALEGAMYEKILRQGRMVSLPKPFIFSVSPRHDGRHRCAIVFYDNAGEHFEPGVDDLNSPGAQHVATAASVLFLFDPTANLEFRQRLSGHHDPQLQISQQLDQQDIILSEMNVRLHRLLHLPVGTPMDRPMAVLVGKCDVWLHLLKDRHPVPPVHDGQLDLDIVAQNSAIVRDLLQEMCPEIVANAESIASDVVYFPVSSFGHSPTRLSDGRIAPDPKKLHPMFVDAPMVWVLSKIVPGLIPVVEAETHP